MGARAAEIRCAPRDLPDWVWQRFLVAQPLPLAALLHGLEPLHAAAVDLDGRAVLLSGTSGAGKSSVLLHLLARGARFLADDVSALEARDDAVVVHPAPRLASVDTAALARLPGEGATRLARLGVLEGEARLLVGPAASAPSRVASIYVLRRTDAAVGLAVAPPRLEPAKVLLGATFNAYVDDPRRLARQLDVTARLARDAVVREVRVPPGAGAAAVAAAVVRAERDAG